MNRLRFWLLRFLFPDSDPRSIAAFMREGPAGMSESGSKIYELERALADTNSEMNALRNSQAERPAQSPQGQVRKLRNWSEFKAAIGGRPLPDAPPTILIGRTTA